MTKLYSIRISNYIHPDIISYLIKLINIIKYYHATVNNTTANKHKRGCVDIYKLN